MNCCLFIISEEEMIGFDKREWFYERLELSDSVENYNISGKAYAYISKKNYTIVKPSGSIYENAIRNSYLEILEDAFSNLGEEYRQKFYRSTVSFDSTIVVDDLRI